MKSKMLGLVVALACSVAQAQEVTATGSGSSFPDALQNAKVLATEYVANTFITGRQDLVNGKYNETLGQYNGGFIQKYEVTNTVVTSGIYAVTIHADVDTDKVNKVIVANTTSVNDAVPHVEKAVDEFNKTVNGWDAIDGASKPFAVALDNTTYSVYDGRAVDVTYHLHMVWNPKWIDDAKQLVKAVGRSPVSGEGTYAVCFKNNDQDGGTCGGVLILPTTKYWRTTEFAVVVHFKDGTSQLFKEYANPAQRLYSDRDVRIQESGWFKPIVTVPAVSLFQDVVSPFDIGLELSVEKFKNVSDVTFTLR